MWMCDLVMSLWGRVWSAVKKHMNTLQTNKTLACLIVSLFYTQKEVIMCSGLVLIQPAPSITWTRCRFMTFVHLHFLSSRLTRRTKKSHKSSHETYTLRTVQYPHMREHKTVSHVQGPSICLGGRGGTCHLQPHWLQVVNLHIWSGTAWLEETWRCRMEPVPAPVCEADHTLTQAGRHCFSAWAPRDSQ